MKEVYFQTRVMMLKLKLMLLKLRNTAKGHFVTLINSGEHLIMWLSCTTLMQLLKFRLHRIILILEKVGGYPENSALPWPIISHNIKEL